MSIDLMFSDEEIEYINRPVEEEFLSYEEYSRIKALREAERIKTKYKGGYVVQPIVYNIGDRVKFNYDTDIPVKKSNRFWYSTTKKVAIGGIIAGVNLDGTFNITSSMGYFENVKHVAHRKVKNTSDVVIPEGLKKISTDRLLTMFRVYSRAEQRGLYDEYYKRINFMFTVSEIRAELNTREHIYTKEDRKLLKIIKNKTKK